MSQILQSSLKPVSPKIVFQPLSSFLVSKPYVFYYPSAPLWKGVQLVKVSRIFHKKNK